MNYEKSFSRYDAQPVEAEPAPVRPRARWPIFVALALCALILAISWYSYSQPKPGAANGKPATTTKIDKQVPNVSVIVPGQSAVPNVITATGSLAARRDMPIGAVGEGGQVVRVLVEPGQWVRAGQMLAIVDRQVQTQQTGQIAAQIRVAEADARLAQNELDRAKALASRGFVSRADIDRKTAQRDRAMAQLAVARAQLGENDARLRRLDIRAPSSGLILERNVEPGQVVGPNGAVLFRIAQDGAFEMHAQLSESDLVRTRVGQGATITPVGSEQGYGGRIWQIEPVINPQTRQGTVRIALPYNRALRPGGFASAKINIGSIQAPLLPESAVQSDGKKNYVYIVDADNRIVRRDVTVGTINELGASILAGLDGSERVVLSAGGFLNPGETVKPVAAKPAG